MAPPSDQRSGDPALSPGRAWLSAWLPVLLYAGLLFVMSSIPSRRMPESDLWQYDKLVHAVAFGVLALLVYRALRMRRRGWSPLWAGAVTVLGVSAYGALDELHQSLVPGRFMSGLDLVADVVGASLVVAVLVLVEAWRKSRGGRT